MVEDNRRVDENAPSCTVRIRKSPAVRVLRRMIIIQFCMVTFSPTTG